MKVRLPTRLFLNAARNFIMSLGPRAQLAELCQTLFGKTDFTWVEEESGPQNAALHTAILYS